MHYRSLVLIHNRLYKIHLKEGVSDMIKAMHGLSTMHSNLVTDIRIAAECGFDALEITDIKILRYLENGYLANDLNSIFDKYNIKPVCINALKSVERIEKKEKAELIREAERLILAAKTIHCPVIQLVPFCGLEGKSSDEVVELTSQNIAEIADMGFEYGVSFQLEPIAWSPIHSLAKSLEVLHRVNRKNVGMVIDFWHLWAGGETKPEDIAKLDNSIIYGVHFCDGIQHIPGTEYIEEVLRGYLPGEGDIPVQKWVDAVIATGFDGVWSSELLSPKHWEWDILEIAKKTKIRLESYTNK